MEEHKKRLMQNYNRRKRLGIGRYMTKDSHGYMITNALSVANVLAFLV